MPSVTVPSVMPGRVAGIVDVDSSASKPINIGKPVTARSLAPVEAACVHLAGARKLHLGGNCIPHTFTANYSRVYYLNREAYTEKCRALIRIASDDNPSSTATIQLAPNGFSTVVTTIAKTGTLSAAFSQLVTLEFQIGAGTASDKGQTLVTLSIFPPGGTPGTWTLYSVVFEPVAMGRISV